MIEPLDRCGRDSALFRFTTGRLRDFIDPSHLLTRIDRDGFGAIFDGLNDEFLRMGLLSSETSLDSSLVKANVNSQDLSPGGMTVNEFKEQAVQVNGLFVIAETTFDTVGVKHKGKRYFQKDDGRLPLSPVEIDARWRTIRPGKPAGLHCYITRERHCRPGRFHPVQGESLTPPRGSGKPFPICWHSCPCNQYLWQGTPVTTSLSFANCWKNETLRPSFPSTPSRKPTWSPEAGLCITAITRSV